MTLQNWLDKLLTIHKTEMDFTLDRMRLVAEKLGVLKPEFKVITVGGTNGKGSTVACIEQILLASGKKVGATTSPHLFRYNERIRLNGLDISDEKLCELFEQIDFAREEMTLTYFEFGVMAALLYFTQEKVDVAVLEVGLGGRLDAVNIIDADVAVVTNVSLDHMHILGNTRESIAKEKAGIIRSNRPIIYGEKNIPESFLGVVNALKAYLVHAGIDGEIQENKTGWQFKLNGHQYNNLARPNVLLINAACAIAAIEQLKMVELNENILNEAFKNVAIPGRLQLVEGLSKAPTLIDVAHNEGSVATLAEYLKERSCHGRVISVFSALADKDITGFIQVVLPYIDEWHIAPLAIDRGASLRQLKQNLEKQKVSCYNSIQEAYKTVCEQVSNQDLILVFGSFYTVCEVFKHKEIM